MWAIYFDTLLIAKVGAETLYGNVHLGRTFEWIPVEGNCIVCHLLNGTDNAT